MFARVLVANRGEIAVRVTRTLRRLGIEAIAVYSDADAGAPHVRAADRALRLGPAAPAESYLHVERVLDAAARAGAEAIHPGYGFLSERPDFARACRDAGLVFIGPGPEAMALLGDKVAAKETAAAAGVPILPGLAGEALSDDEIVAWAADQELPLLLKAAAGGGGKGMRIVRAFDELPDALGAARREAQGAFGDDRLLVERYLERSRHIEVQVIADQHGTVLHLGERECSMQRRHQKVIEEAPSPVVDAALRARMGEAAVDLARGADYVNAGTVELISPAEDPGAFCFLEMNARLQVEHPVTEAVTGLDLVELQLRVAAGEPLGLAHEDVAIRGHAIEARLYAEDPAHGFLPSTGRIVAYREPGGDGALTGEPSTPIDDGARESATVRIDSGIATGVEVTGDYDPMLAKVIAHAPDRAGALARLARALRDTLVLGPTTNAAYLRALLARPEVQAGALDTTLIERLGPAIAPPAPDPALPAIAAAALLGPPPTDDPWDARDAWRLTGPAAIQVRLEGPDGERDVTLRQAADRGWEWHAGDAAGTLRLGHDRGEADTARAPRLADITVETADGTRTVACCRDGDAIWLIDDGTPSRFVPAEPDQAGHKHAAGSLEAPMPGTVIAVRAEPGADVEEGDVLVVLESMKMELAVQSPGEGTVTEILVTTGDRVTRGQPLVTLADRAPEPAAEPAAGQNADPAPEPAAEPATGQNADRAGGAGWNDVAGSAATSPIPATGPARHGKPGSAR